jgi:hypothetical protein
VTRTGWTVRRIGYLESDDLIAAVGSGVGGDGEAGRAVHDLDLGIVDALAGRVGDATADVTGRCLRGESGRADRQRDGDGGGPQRQTEGLHTVGFPR